MRALTKLSAFLLVCMTLVYGGYRAYKHLSEVDAVEQQELAKHKEWVYARIQESVTGSHDVMVAVAREYTGEKNVEVGPCNWSAALKWGRSYKNPNWFSDTKNSTGMHVWCEVTLQGVPDEGSELLFEWDWGELEGVTSFSWGPDVLNAY